MSTERKKPRSNRRRIQSAANKNPRQKPRGTALVVVDLQRAFSVPVQVVARIQRFSREFPVRVFTRFVNPPRSLFRRKLGMTCCPPGSPDTELVLTPAKGDLVLDKPAYGLNRTQIARLRAKGITRAVVCGVETDACVLGIMFSLFDAGIDASIEPTLCWSSTGLHREALKIIAMQFKPELPSRKT